MKSSTLTAKLVSDCTLGDTFSHLERGSAAWGNRCKPKCAAILAPIALDDGNNSTLSAQTLPKAKPIATYQ
eukprot:5571113-Amphidinium_carterae.1